MLAAVQTFSTTLEMNLMMSQEPGNSSTQATFILLLEIYLKMSHYNIVTLLTYIHITFIHDSQKLETPLMSLN